MPKTKAQTDKSQSQSDKFKAMAKEVGADGSEASFDKLVRKVAKDGKPKSRKT